MEEHAGWSGAGRAAGSPAATVPLGDDVYRRAVDAAREGMWLVDLAGNTVLANAAMAEMLGVEPGSLDGRSAFDFAEEADRAELEAALARRARGLSEVTEGRFVRPDGQEVWTICNATPFVVDGEVMGALALFTDITERRAEEQRLLFQAHVLSEMAEGVAAISLDGLVRFVNPALREILRLPDIEIVGLNVFELPGEPESWAARLKVGIEEARQLGAFSVEGTRNRYDGSTITLRTTYTPYHDAGGTPQGIVIVCRDATDEVEAREMLSRRAAQHQALADLSAVALRTSDFRGLCQEAARLVGHVLDADHAAVGELDGWSYTQIAAAGPATLAPGAVVDLSAFAAEIAPLRRAAPVIVDDLRPLASGAQIGVVRGSILGVPARFGERAGVVSAHHGQPNAFGATEAAFLSSVGNVLSAAADRLETLERISHSALHDPLTGLPNRTLLLDRVGQACARRDREPRGVAVIVCDVDHFKLVNDAQGHAQGDRLLRMVANRLASSLRRSDTLAHLSSDTFAVLSEGVADPQHATVLAGRLIEAIREPFALDGHRYYLTISVGIALLEGRRSPASCCATRMPPCTARRSTGVDGRRCSTPASSPLPCTSWRSPATCATPSTRASWCSTTSHR